jgi:hypothetical protein
MRLTRTLLAELIERVSTRVIARLLEDTPSSALEERFGVPPVPEDKNELLTHDEVQQMLSEREAMRARHPQTEPSPPPDPDDEPPVGSLEWRSRQTDIRRIKG